jgi:thiamine-phosphate pyrophosphorylase
MESPVNEALARIRGLYGMVDLGPGSSAPGRLARALLDGGARVLQLRMKDASAADMLAVVDELRPLCKQREATFIVNDRLDVAMAGGADGVHLGQDDLPLDAARRLAPGMIIGVSTHDEAQARRAIAGGADYIGFGPCFPTRTKINPDPVVGLTRLAAVCRLGAPVVAIGGIALDHLADVVHAGATAAALISAVNGAADVVTAARRATTAFAR